MISKNKIAVVAVYFGKLPNYFPLWLKSCKHNPTIDFYLFTDNSLSNLPANVQCVSMTLLEMQRRATKVLCFDAVLTRPYKCCDYKPLYGLLFADYLASYDYWGHCDIDLIFGDLQYFFDVNHLYDYDKFNTLGHLSLFRNCQEVNTAYLIPNKRKDYRKVYTNEKNETFDELDGISSIMMESGFRVFTKRIFIDIATKYHRYRIGSVYPLDVKPTNYPIQTYCWEDGKVYHIYMKDDSFCKEEYMYIHFQKRPNYPITDALIQSNSFFLTNHGFYSADGIVLTKELVLKLNPYYGKIYEQIEYLYRLYTSKIKSRLKRSR